jgi:hypothetical protein
LANPEYQEEVCMKVVEFLTPNVELRGAELLRRPA